MLSSICHWSSCFCYCSPIISSETSFLCVRCRCCQLLLAINIQSTSISTRRIKQNNEREREKNYENSNEQRTEICWVWSIMNAWILGDDEQYFLVSRDSAQICMCMFCSLIFLLLARPWPPICMCPPKRHRYKPMISTVAFRYRYMYLDVRS